VVRGTYVAIDSRKTAQQSIHTTDLTQSKTDSTRPTSGELQSNCVAPPTV